MVRVVVTGGTGFLGVTLVRALCGRGDEVTVLTRDPERARSALPPGARAVAWSADVPGPWCDELARADAVVHLAGENVIGRWSDRKKQAIRASREGATRVLVDAIAAAKTKPRVLVSASAIGFYGPRDPDETLDEASTPGSGFLAEVVQRWEAEASRVEELGVRAVLLRIGVVLGEGGGALEKMILPFRFFAGGPVGDGTHVVSWVHRDDIVGLVLFAIDRDDVRGPLNAVAPEPVTAGELARAIGRAMHRPSWLPAPKFALRAAMGEAAEVLTTGQRVVPKRALELGYVFRHPSVMPALGSILPAS